MWQSLGVSIKIVQLSPPLETFLWQSRNFSKFENSHFGEILLLFGEILSLFWEILPTRPWNQPTCLSVTSTRKWMYSKHTCLEIVNMMMMILIMMDYNVDKINIPNILSCHAIIVEKLQILMKKLYIWRGYRFSQDFAPIANLTEIMLY